MTQEHGGYAALRVPTLWSTPACPFDFVWKMPSFSLPPHPPVPFQYLIPPAHFPSSAYARHAVSCRSISVWT
jgi:hypothetical protein